MFESLHGPVKEICPRTGEYIDTKPVDTRLTVYHYLKTTPRPRDYLGTLKRKMKTQGFKSLTAKEIEAAYKRMKEICKRYDSHR